MSARVSEYELQRLENIKRNEDLLASLNIKSKLAEIASANRLRTQTRSYKVKPKKTETLTTIRKSLRTQGITPDSSGLKYHFRQDKSNYVPRTSPRDLGQITMKDASACFKSKQLPVNQILKSRLKEGCNADNHRVKALIDLDSMYLAPQNVAQVGSARISSLKFFPSPDMMMLVVGSGYGTVAFWNADSSENQDGHGVYRYRIHPGLISSILIQPFSMNKIITCCYGGQVRSLDIEKEAFDLLYSSDKAVSSMSQRPDDVKSFYLGEGQGVVGIWDERFGRSSFSWKLHDDRINTIDFNSENTNIMATSSSDGTACIWDLRKFGRSKPQSLKRITRGRVVYSAYFSPSGNLLATTSLDNKIGVLSGMNYEDEFIIDHNNQTGCKISSFKGVWGWDDSYIFVGNMKKGVDVISTDAKRLVTTLKSPHMSAIPCRFDTHPLKPGMLAGAASKGQVYIWTS